MKYKIFSFDTTIRNPHRNLVFLQTIEKFNGEHFNEDNYILYWNELIGKGIYRPNKLKQNIKEKLYRGDILNKEEVLQIMEDNPQSIGYEARAKSHFKALHSVMLINYDSRKTRVSISKLGRELLKNPNDIQNIYTKIMLGLHFSSPIRKVKNEARVFLNTIFVIDLLKKEWEKLGNSAKGILKYEFSFVLGMKDCNYKKCVKDILDYRKKFGLKENQKYIENYLFNELKLEPVKYNTLKDYCDEVFRKFQMTGLIISRGEANHAYYDFSHFNLNKIKSLLEKYKNFKFQTFSNTSEYIDFLDKIKLPWNENNEIKKEVIKQKAKSLKIELKESEFANLNILEEKLNQEFYSQILARQIQKSDIKELLGELKILASKLDKKSKFEDIAEPLRLEYLLALILGKKYGITKLQSNLIYNENGLPLSYAPAGRADLSYNDFLFEATMIKNKNQQLNSETTSIVRHMKECEEKHQIKMRTMLIAPYIHWDVALFFKFCLKEFKSKIAPLSITKFIDLIEMSENFSDFCENFDKIFVKNLENTKSQNYVDFINSKRTSI